MKIWPTPEAPSASFQAAQGQGPCSSAGANGTPFVSGLGPLEGATPADRQSRFRGVRLLAWSHCDQWSV